MDQERGGATGPQIVTRSRGRVKEERDGDSTDGYLHRFPVKSSSTEPNEYTIDCDQPRTVLEAIKSTEKYKEKMKSSDKNIVIQLGKTDKTYIIATHFPCSCIRRGASLILSHKSKEVEAVQDQQDKTIQPRDEYSVFYIETAKTKKPFRNNAVKKFDYLCVYGEKGMTVEEALKRDGRFIDDFGSFYLSDNENPSSRTKRTQTVDNLDKKKFKICLPRGKGKKDKKQQEKPGASKNPPQKRERGIKPLDDVVKQRGISVRAAMKEKDSKLSDEEIYEELRQQFPKLKEWMESRFPPDSYQKALDLKKEDFENIQRLFSEVHREMMKLGESVCKVVVQNGATGTGFVLFDNFILTNARILKGCVEDEKLKLGIDVYALFNYNDPEPHMNYYCFQAHRGICYSEGELDYAILRLNLESQNPSTQTKETKVDLPPGLLKRFGKLPTTGEACLIGHPAGELKKIDPTCIIEKENREQTVDDDIPSYKDKRFVIHIINDLKEQGIESIMMGQNKADNVTTYNTFMYHGASGSPVFDEHGNVFGLHTGGFVYGFPSDTKSVIEYAQPVLTIFEHFVRMMKERENGQSLLKRVGEEAKGNSELEKVLESVLKETLHYSRYSAGITHSFNFALINTQSLNNKALEVRDLILDNSLDFLLLTETWQKPDDVSAIIQASPPNFDYLCKPRLFRRGGGLAVLFNRNLRTTELTLPTVTSFESLAFETCSTTVILIYCPNKQNSSYRSDLSKLLTLASSLPLPLLLLGDFNIHMDSPNSKLTSDFSTLLDNFNLTQHVNFPTHDYGHSLDLVCSDNVPVLNIHPSPFPSDHKLIQFTILSPKPRPQLSRVIDPLDLSDLSASLNSLAPLRTKTVSFNTSSPLVHIPPQKTQTDRPPT
ncbi:protein FAM111A-like isoform X2 [Sebastes umbrosus]|uniref:protein FAM111A-like isoform X2 n=1 Tax=Sebastes umbrosus TaxID=72105 RepID=UPI00189E9193|nr:protein FAM111A-like isoform X2 [Sebastes umbrosus]